MAENRIEYAKQEAKVIGGNLVDRAIELALVGWIPPPGDDAALAILKRGLPLLMDEVRAAGLIT